MSSVKFVRNFALTILILSLAAVATFAQKGKDKDKGKPSEDPTGNARNVKPELKDAYKRWLSTDVDYIITKDEKRAFLALTTDEERENFIENFWRRRDPNPDCSCRIARQT